ncbi:hypothetical protein AYI69_g8543 [Smittium culicis]|uniref:Uncharacterized protein n=1 Tax=Smittium culicis TaxID=133412 RepID=A0A1R1XIZ5_9FUNG|nr:hypothetical protein AYI69_g8543 [Smittium culicis]
MLILRYGKLVKVKFRQVDCDIAPMDHVFVVASINNVPARRIPCLIHHFLSANDRPPCGKNRVHSTVSGTACSVSIKILTSFEKYSIMSMILLGLLLLVIIVHTPAAIASSAATSFVAIPPVPTELPTLDTSTDPTSFDISSTASTLFASGLFLGLSVYKQSTSVSKNK